MSSYVRRGDKSEHFSADDCATSPLRHSFHCQSSDTTKKTYQQMTLCFLLEPSSSQSSRRVWRFLLLRLFSSIHRFVRSFFMFSAFSLLWKNSIHERGGIRSINGSKIPGMGESKKARKIPLVNYNEPTRLPAPFRFECRKKGAKSRLHEIRKKSA